MPVSIVDPLDPKSLKHLSDQHEPLRGQSVLLQLLVLATQNVFVPLLDQAQGGDHQHRKPYHERHQGDYDVSVRG